MIPISPRNNQSIDGETAKAAVEKRKSVRIQEEALIDLIVNRWDERSGFSITEFGRKRIRFMVRKYDFEFIIECLDISADQYLKIDGEDQYTKESAEKAFKYIHRICFHRSSADREPHIEELFYIRGILRNRLTYCDERKSLEYLKQAFSKGKSIEYLSEYALVVKNWTEFKARMEMIINGNDTNE